MLKARYGLAGALALLAAGCGTTGGTFGNTADADDGSGTGTGTGSGTGSDVIDASSGGSGHTDARRGDARTYDAPSGIDAPPSAGDLRFAIVGDTRPPNEDDTSSYPTSIITSIFEDVEAMSPKPQFVVTTGDYMFANPTGTQGAAQLALYEGARQKFSGTVYPAMGNHECTGYTDSNCGSGNKDGITNNYTDFMTTMLGPLGYTEPYYEVDVADPNGTWTAKLVFIAGNAWGTAQSTWLDAALSKPTTYTFVIRHEGVDATTAPGVTPSGTIIAKHPLTLLIVGHTHTYAHYASDHEVICGNGGAPLTSGKNYGYGVIDRRSDGAITFTEYDYQSNAVVDTWVVTAAGATTH